jgi:hypothetical protein
MKVRAALRKHESFLFMLVGSVNRMKQISEVEKKPFMSSLNICPEACAGIFEQSMEPGNK